MDMQEEETWVPEDFVGQKYHAAATAAAKSLQSCPTLCDPVDGSPPGCPIPGILQARTLEWAAISFSNAWKWKVKVKLLSRVRLCATAWTAAYQALPSMGFSRQEYWSGMPPYQPGIAFLFILYKREKLHCFFLAAPSSLCDLSSHNQGLNLGPCSESAKSQSLNHQRIPKLPFFRATFFFSIFLTFYQT